jgi:hypothetical protein
VAGVAADGATTEVPCASELRTLMAATESVGRPLAVLESLGAPGSPCEIAEGEAGERDEPAPASVVREGADDPAGASA